MALVESGLGHPQRHLAVLRLFLGLYFGVSTLNQWTALLGVLVIGGGEPKRLTAVVHRRAEFLRPSPSVPIRGLRCAGRVAVAVLFAL